MPVKKTGDEATRTANMVAPTSIQVLRWTAGENAEGHRDHQREQERKPDSFAVSGSRSRISVVTSVRCR